MAAIDMWSNITSPDELLGAANSVTSWFWVAVIFMIVIIVFLVLLPSGYEISGITASLMGVIGSIFLVAAGLTNAIWTLGICLAILLGLIFYIFGSSTRENT